MLCQRSSDIAPFAEHPVYSNFKMYILLILVLCFYLPQFTQNVSAKVVYSWNCRCSAKGAVVLLRLWRSLYLAVWNRIVSLFYFFFSFFFFLRRFTQNTSTEVIFSRNFRCSTKGAVILRLSWSTLYIAFSKCKMSWFYFWFATINPNYICKSQVFLNF